MGKLKKCVLDLIGREEDVKDFKITLVNKIDYKRESIELDYSDEERNYGEIPIEFSNYSTTFEFPAPLAVEILSELGYEKNKLEMKIGTEQLGSNYYESYRYCDFNDMWNFIKGLEEKDFLVAMLLISSSNSHWNSITTIQHLVIRELNNFKFKIDYKISTVFIAMSFGEEMQKARQSISKVIEEFGYQPMLIDIKEHNNQIVPEIFSEIENAEFIVADLTEQKRGVYLEAGYAMAKGKQVILSCKSDDFEQNHFDVNQINTIIWSDEEVLEKRLRTRIKAMHLQNF